MLQLHGHNQHTEIGRLKPGMASGFWVNQTSSPDELCALHATDEISYMGSAGK